MLEEMRTMGDTCGWRFGEHIRILDTRSGRHCNNKLVIVDGRMCLVGSANWSESGVTRNREACLLIDSSEIAGYYQQIFQSDWNAGLDPFAADG
jgi:hypothetical protein